MSKQRMYSVEYVGTLTTFVLEEPGFYLDDSGKNLRQIACELFRKYFGHAASSCDQFMNFFCATDEKGNELAIYQFDYGHPYNQLYVNHFRANGAAIPDAWPNYRTPKALNALFRALRPIPESQAIHAFVKVESRRLGVPVKTILRALRKNTVPAAKQEQTHV